MTAADRPIVPGAVVRWRETSERRRANGYSTETRYRVLAIRVVPEDAGRFRRGERLVIMARLTDLADDRRPFALMGDGWRVHERDVERVPR